MVHKRITQPDPIAVIYSMEKELGEYHRYIEYLQAMDYIKKPIQKEILLLRPEYFMKKWFVFGRKKVIVWSPA